MAEVKMTMTTSCKSTAISNNTSLVEYCDGHDEDIALKGIAVNWIDINRQVLSLHRHMDASVKGEDPKILINLFETSKYGSHQLIEIAPNYFVGFLKYRRWYQSTVNKLKPFLFQAKEETKRFPKWLKTSPECSYQVVLILGDNLLKSCLGKIPLFCLPITTGPLCDWPQFEPWVIAPNLFIKT